MIAFETICAVLALMNLFVGFFRLGQSTRADVGTPNDDGSYWFEIFTGAFILVSLVFLNFG